MKVLLVLMRRKKKDTEKAKRAWCPAKKNFTFALVKCRSHARPLCTDCNKTTRASELPSMTLVKGRLMRTKARVCKALSTRTRCDLKAFNRKAHVIHFPTISTSFTLPLGREYLEGAMITTHPVRYFMFFL